MVVIQIPRLWLRPSLYPLLLHHFVLLSSAAAQELHRSQGEDLNPMLTRVRLETAAGQELHLSV